MIKLDYILYDDIKYNIITREIKGDWEHFHLKKNLTCRICSEIDVKVKIVDGAHDFSTLKKL